MSTTTVKADSDTERPIRWWHKLLRHALAFAFLFSVALALRYFVNPETAKAYPNPLWLPVIILSLQLGLGAAIVSAALAAGIFFWYGLPPQVWSEDFYQYAGRIGFEPVAWTIMALLIGFIRRHQIQDQTDIKAELAHQHELGRELATRCEDLRQRADVLERHIAANVVASQVDVCEAACGLSDADASNFADRLRRFIATVMATPEFGLYLLQNNTLNAAVGSADEYQNRLDGMLPQLHPLFGPVVSAQKTLLVTRQADRKLLGAQDCAIGPLVDPALPHRVIGILRIGGSNQVEFPESLERRFALAQSEVSRAVSRLLKSGVDSVKPATAAETTALPAKPANVSHKANPQWTGTRVL